MQKNQLFSLTRTTLVSMVLSGVLFACGDNSGGGNQTVVIDGSSTVFPVTNAILEKFKTQHDADNVRIDFSGSIGGFKKFCNGETDINNASVPIPQRFMEECKKNGIAYIELPIAFDALTVAVNPQNDWAEVMTVEELKNIWQPSAEGVINNWSQVNSRFPNRTLNLFGPGRDSGTFEFFTTAIVGESNSSRNDFVFSEDDEALVQGVAQDPNALGYFGYAYYVQHQDKLKPVSIDNGNGPVEPSDETIINNTYRPLTRPLFIYVNADKAQDNKTLIKFVNFYLDNAATVVGQVGYLPLPESGYKLGHMHFHNNRVGTVFNGKPVLNASIRELLTRSYAEDGAEGYVY